MTRDQELEAALRGFLHDVPTPAERMRIGALERIGRTPQRRAGLALLQARWTWAPRAIAAGVVLAAGSLLVLQLRGVVPPADVAAPSGLVETPRPSPSAPPAGSTPSATPEARTIVVAQAGGADARSIGEALAMAQAGDTILVRPPIDPTYGSYTEPGLSILRPVTIRGSDQERRIRVHLAQPAVPQYDDYFHSLWLAAPQASIEDLELRPSEGGGGGDLTLAGSLTLERVTLQGVWVDAQRDGAALTIRDSDILESGVTAPGPLRIEGSNVIDSTIEAGHREADASVIRDSRFTSSADPGSHACESAALTVTGTALVEQNVFSGRGICVTAGSGTLLRANRFSGAQVAIRADRASGLVIADNELVDNELAVELVGVEDVMLTGNTLTGNRTAVAVGLSSGAFRDNVINGNERAIDVVGTGQLPELTGNQLCENGTNLRVLGSAEVSLAGNEICPDQDPPAAMAGGSGPALNWEPVAIDFVPAHPYGDGRVRFQDGRFLERADDGQIHGSVDGLTWAPILAAPDEPVGQAGTDVFGLGDGWVVHRESSTVVEVVEADGSARRHTFGGPVSEVAVSPAGIVVVESVRVVDVIRDVLGAAVAEGDWRLVREDRVEDPERPDWGDRVTWWLETDEGLVTLRLADHGYGGVAGWDERPATLGWRSPDGREWTPIRSVPLSWDDSIVGTQQGFWWRHGNDEVTSLWHSADGRAWNKIGSLTGYEMLPWRDGVIVRDGDDILAATPAGLRRLAVSEAPLAERQVLAGPMGLLLLDRARGLLVFSPDGEAWSLTDMPAEWTGPGDTRVTAAVGADAVVVRIDRCAEAGDRLDDCFEADAGLVVSELWRGTVAP